MHFTAIVASTVLALATGANAWAQAGNGVWTANNWYHTIRGVRVHEACTRMNDANTILRGEACAYWVDGAGTIFHGSCILDGNTVNCR